MQAWGPRARATTWAPAGAPPPAGAPGGAPAGATTAGRRTRLGAGQGARRGSRLGAAGRRAAWAPDGAPAGAAAWAPTGAPAPGWTSGASARAADILRELVEGMGARERMKAMLRAVEAIDEDLLPRPRRGADGS